MVEEWRDIPNYEGLYQISNLGRVKSLDRIVNKKNNTSSKIKGKLIKLNVYKNGTVGVHLWKENNAHDFRVDKLVCMVFFKKYNSKMTIYHMDGDAKNNNINNLTFRNLTLDVDDEEWKDIDGFEGLYQISNKARVKSLERFVSKGNDDVKHLIRQKILNPSLGTTGYYYVRLWKNNKCTRKTIHKLVAETFIDRVKDKNIINHLDGVKTNNIPSNLEWTNHKGNLIHAYENELNPNQKRTKLINLKSGENIIFNSMSKASVYMGKCPTYISWRRNNNKKNYNKEYKWEVLT